ncbi:MAG: sigma-54-dependent transcriptional regulator [Pseudomonadota bacterium]|uniref:sigma-54-dependent transcriptional regulator n=1 Tax=uncultured Sphingomonas sp. TaxID=158754 RepID=UPI0030F98D48
MKGMTPAVRLLLVGAPGSEFRLAADLARAAGADVTMADDAPQAIALLRMNGGDLVMIDVDADVRGFLQHLRDERFAVPVIACGINASAQQAVAAIRAGARDYLPLPPERALIAAAIASVVTRGSIEILGDAPDLARARNLALAVARSASPVLLVGETGTGKGLMARAIHEASGRLGPILVVECAGVAPEIVDSELFGHEEGAFAGALGLRIGRFEKAGSGTILLREVGALSPGTQARLLSALQEHHIRRVGGNHAVAVQARVLATSTIDLQQRVAAGAFRADLLARLGLARIEMPPLRARRGDIALLARHFAHRLADADGLSPRPLSEAAEGVLQAYGWPGNVSELEDAIHRAVLIARGPRIEARDIVLVDGSQLAQDHAPTEGRLEIEGLVGRTVEEVERELILQTLQRCHGNRTSASGILGISVRTMRNKLKTFIEAGIAVSPAP